MSDEQFKVTIDLGTFPALLSIKEIAQALRRVAATIEHEHVIEDSDWPSGAIRDETGKKIGDWEIAKVHRK
jgi:hypothetical protein